MASVLGRLQKEKVDRIADCRRRVLQVVRAEGQACKTTAEVLCHDMIERHIELDLAVVEYDRRKAELVKRETEVHKQLAKVLQDRSFSELALEDVRDHAENVLKARRTANTVRAYRLDTRWRRLHGRYRGFVADVLVGGSGGAGGALQQLHSPAPPTKRFGGRFYTAADNLSARNRRESLRTSRSLHTLMAGYLRETSGGRNSGGDAPTLIADRCETPLRHSSPVSLDGAEPERVLDKLRVMQDQCARIAERVRRRTTRRGGAYVVNGVAAGQQLSRPRAHGTDDSDGRHATWQSDLLAEARQRLTTGRQYVAELCVLMDRAVAVVGCEQLALRKLLGKTYVACIGGKAQLNDGDGGGYNTVLQIVGRLERACFTLFALLDRMGTGPEAGSQQQWQQRQRDHRAAYVHDVVTSCLLAVQTHRMRTDRHARDIEHRVHNFHKSVNRLLLATSAVPVAATGGERFRRGRRVVRHKMSLCRQDMATSTTQKFTPKKLQKQTFVSTGSLPKVILAAADTETTGKSTIAATVKIVCPPSIGVIEYE